MIKMPDSYYEKQGITVISHFIEFYDQNRISKNKTITVKKKLNCELESMRFGEERMQNTIINKYLLFCRNIIPQIENSTNHYLGSDDYSWLCIVLESNSCRLRSSSIQAVFCKSC